MRVTATSDAHLPHPDPPSRTSDILVPELAVVERPNGQIVDRHLASHQRSAVSSAWAAFTPSSDSRYATAAPDDPERCEPLWELRPRDRAVRSIVGRSRTPL
jgi:hypothetical protein